MSVRVRKIYEDENGNTCEFFRLDISGYDYAYRVLYNGLAVDWMRSNWTPSIQTAAFFLEKHGKLQKKQVSCK